MPPTERQKVSGLDIEQIAKLQRFDVVGTSGSGKSTFAKRLAEILDLPHYQLDQLYWKPGWRESTKEEFFPKLQQVTDGPAWVIDGNYRFTIPIKWKRVQFVIWLDLSFPRTIFRVTKRTIRRVVTQQEVWPGTDIRESFAKSFLSRESIIWWAITTHRENRRIYSSMMDSPDYAHIPFVRLRSPREVTRWLYRLRQVQLFNGEPQATSRTPAARR